MSVYTHTLTHTHKSIRQTAAGAESQVRAAVTGREKWHGVLGGQQFWLKDATLSLSLFVFLPLSTVAAPSPTFGGPIHPSSQEQASAPAAGRRQQSSNGSGAGTCLRQGGV